MAAKNGKPVGKLTAPKGKTAKTIPDEVSEGDVPEASKKEKPLPFSRTLKSLSDDYKTKEGNHFSLAPLSMLESRQRMLFGNAVLDYMTGGGAPLYAVTSLWGAESAGKTSALFDTADAALRTCWRCGYPVTYCHCSLPPMLRDVGWLAIEGVPDVSWAEHIGCDTGRIFISLPESAEHAFDVANDILSRDVCMLALDSISMVSPEAESSSSAEQQFMALQARAIGRFLRTLRNALNKRVRAQAPVSVFLVNQMRYKVGQIFGSPETRCGGSALKHTDDLLIRFSKVALSKSTNPDKLLLPASAHGMPSGARFNVSVNKTKFFTLSREDSFARLTANNEAFPDTRPGQLLDAAATLKAALACSVITKDSKGYKFTFLDKLFETQSELLSFVFESRENKMLIMKMATEAAYAASKKGCVAPMAQFGPEKVQAES